MKTKIITTSLLICATLQSAEIRIGTGSFGWDMGIGNFMDADFDIDMNVISIANSHDNFSNSPFYFFYDADIYSSDYMDKKTTMMTRPLTHEFPVFGSVNDAIDKYTPIPVPSEYKVSGFDLNLGVGYDLYKVNENYIGVGVVTGLSLPMMKMKDLKKTAEMTYRFLEKTDTDISTYKLGASVQAGVEIVPKLLLHGSASFGYQTGKIENGWIDSSFDVDGGFKTLNVALKYTPWSSHKDLGWINLDPKLYFTAGFTHKSWTVDEGQVDMFNTFSKEVFKRMDLDFDTTYSYIGIGYDF